jgi:hypothetical protein
MGQGWYKSSRMGEGVERGGGRGRGGSREAPPVSAICFL